MARTLTLRDVPEKVVRALRERARRNDRSMREEILEILERTALDRAALSRQLSSLRTRLGARMSLREIHDAIEQRRP